MRWISLVPSPITSSGASADYGSITIEQGGRAFCVDRAGTIIGFTIGIPLIALMLDALATPSPPSSPRTFWRCGYCKGFLGYNPGPVCPKCGRQIL
jgi:hypothetical protein